MQRRDTESSSLELISEQKKKKEKSEARRVASLAAKRALEKQRQAAISQDLKTLDTAVSKKVVFNSDSENEEIPAVAKRRRLKLFDDDEATESSSTGSEINIANRHYGKKGAKLAMLEAKFGHDKRFQMDERFIESNDEGEEEEEQRTEKEAQLAVLSKVFGKTIASKKTVTKLSTLRRFDPENEEHIQWLEARMNKAVEPSVQADTASESTSSVEEITESRVVEGYFYEMDKSFAESLKNKLNEEDHENAGSSAFSFLKNVQQTPIAEIPAQESEKPIMVSDSIIEEVKRKDLSMNGSLANGERAFNLNLSSSASSSFFFLNEKDAEVINVVNNFRRIHSLEAIRRKWCSIRRGIIKLYKGQRKRAVKAEKSERKSFSTNKKGNATATQKKSTTDILHREPPHVSKQS